MKVALVKAKWGHFSAFSANALKQALSSLLKTCVERWSGNDCIIERKWVYYLLRVSLTMSLAPKSYTTWFHNPGPPSQDCLLKKSAGKILALPPKQAVKQAILFCAFPSLPCGVLSIKTPLILHPFHLIWVWPMTALTNGIRRKWCLISEPKAPVAVHWATM